MKCLTPAKAPTTVYRDHLPLLGQHYHHVLQRNELKQGAQSLSHQYNQLQYQQLEIGDRVGYVYLFKYIFNTSMILLSIKYNLTNETNYLF